MIVRKTMEEVRISGPDEWALIRRIFAEVYLVRSLLNEYDDLKAERDAIAAELAIYKSTLDVCQDRNARAHAETRAAEARVAALEADVANWKRLYDRRGLALARPCIACGHVPAVIKPASQSEPPARHCKHDDGDCHADDPCVDCPKFSSAKPPAVQP